MAILLLLLLQIIGSIDLYAAIDLPLHPSSTTHLQPHTHTYAAHTFYKNSHIAFHKNLSDGVEDNNTDALEKHLSASDIITLLIQFAYYSFDIQTDPHLLSGCATNDYTYNPARYLLFSNFRI